ncbi:hypothetical protein FJ958_10560 [Mesorhizobium sp. B2-3-5]|nr:hypothetical protein FJ958_10560 [Mesorhizobium sp. B2-3-5]
MRTVLLGSSWCGLLSGPLSWATSTQVNYVLVPWQCAHQVPVVLPLALTLTLLSLVGGALSWRARRLDGASGRKQSTERFIADLGMGTALLFALVIIMQGSAALIVDGCLR